MKNLTLLWLAGIIFLSLSCRDGVFPWENIPYDGLLYSNSFESLRDTVNWRGYGDMQLKDEAPANCGKKSMYVSGGCIVPHAYINLDILQEDSYIRLECWGKKILGSGMVILKSNIDETLSVSINIKDSVWTKYKSDKILFARAKTPLHLEIMSGGIIPGAVLIDMIQIIKIP